MLASTCVAWTSSALPCLYGSKCALVCQQPCGLNRLSALLLSACPTCTTWLTQRSLRMKRLPVSDQLMKKSGGGSSSHLQTPRSRTTAHLWEPHDDEGEAPISGSRVEEAKDEEVPDDGPEMGLAVEREFLHGGEGDRATGIGAAERTAAHRPLSQGAVEAPDSTASGGSRKRVGHSRQLSDGLIPGAPPCNFSGSRTHVHLATSRLRFGPIRMPSLNWMLQPCTRQASTYTSLQTVIDLKEPSLTRSLSLSHTLILPLPPSTATRAASRGRGGLGGFGPGCHGCEGVARRPTILAWHRRSSELFSAEGPLRGDEVGYANSLAYLSARIRL